MSQNPGDGEEILSLLEAAHFLGISQRTLQRLLEQGALRGSKVGRQWRFRKRDLETYLKQEPEPLPEPPAEDLEAGLQAIPDGPAEVRMGGFSGGDADAPPPLVPPAVVRLADAVIQEAFKAGASDIHLEPYGRGMRVRYRLDGVLHEVYNLPGSLLEPLIARYKQLAEMNAAERRLPQVGRFSATWEDREYDLRVSSLPTVRGEKMVMRVVVKDVALLLPGLTRLGLFPETQARLEAVIARSQGLVVVAGATGTGKTTTLYSLLNRMDTVARNVISVEDPVECLLPGVAQVGVSSRMGLTYPVALRTCMRQDPDTIMVGEIRDLETLELACQAAMTGHLVLTALHVESAVQVPGRLMDVGLAPFLVAANLSAALAQRLARKLCEACRRAGEPDPADIERLRARGAAGGETLARGATFYQAQGCDACRATGYRGRIGLFELLEVTPTFRSALLRRPPEEELEAIAVGQGMRTLAADGLRKAAQGTTSVEEVVRVLALS